LFRCSSRTVRLSFPLFLFFFDFGIGSFLDPSSITQAERNHFMRLKSVVVKLFLDMRYIHA
jgi:hypothetical protein